MHRRAKADLYRLVIFHPAVDDSAALAGTEITLISGPVASPRQSDNRLYLYV
jgi:hypothetical protein